MRICPLMPDSGFPGGGVNDCPQSGELDFKANGCQIKRNVSSHVQVWDPVLSTGSQTNNTANTKWFVHLIMHEILRKVSQAFALQHLQILIHLQPCFYPTLGIMQL